MRVTAKAQRSDGWWAVEVPEVAGVFTQARRLDQIPEMVADAVALVVGVNAADVLVDVVPITNLDSIVAEAREARRIADEAGARASELVRFVLANLAQAGYTVRDAGQLLGISAQRASQLTAPLATNAEAAAAAKRYRKFVEEMVANVHDTKAQAQSAGRDIARNRGVEHVTKRTDSIIGRSYSYGSDPHPPGGTRFTVKSSQHSGDMAEFIEIATGATGSVFLAPIRDLHHRESTEAGQPRRKQRV